MFLPLVVAAAIAAQAVDATPPDTTRSAAARTTKPRKPAVVEVVARDYAFTVPASIPAGLVTFRLRNEGKELHHFWIVRLTGGKTFQDFTTYMRTHGEHPAPWAVNVGGPQPPAPGGTSNATLLLTPGNYAVFCLIPGPDGKPHMAKGMAQPLTVTAVATTSAPPGTAKPTMKADIDLGLVDYDFRFSKPLTAGEHTLHVHNDATQAHELVIVKLAPGKTLAEALGWAQKMAGEPPFAMVGGITGLDHGQEAFMQAKFTPGDYALICFVPDAKDGKPHSVHGMATQLRVE
jgi:uncharacterized cupredoxin-like copper-binding protein